MLTQDQEECSCTSRGYAWEHWRSDHDDINEDYCRIVEALEELDFNIKNGWTESGVRAQEESWPKARNERIKRVKRLQKQLWSPTYIAAMQFAIKDDTKLTQSIDTVLSTDSEFAHAQMAAQSRSSEVRDFRRIGGGNAGIVFAQEGRSVVFKVARSNPTTLHNDHQMHLRVAAAFETLSSI